MFNVTVPPQFLTSVRYLISLYRRQRKERIGSKGQNLNKLEDALHGALTRADELQQQIEQEKSKTEEEKLKAEEERLKAEQLEKQNRKYKEENEKLRHKVKKSIVCVIL